MKSDDVAGRTRMYESIVKGDYMLESGLPESFNVLLKELQALALDVELLETAPRRSVGAPHHGDRRAGQVGNGRLTVWVRRPQSIASYSFASRVNP